MNLTIQTIPSHKTTVQIHFPPQAKAASPVAGNSPVVSDSDPAAGRPVSARPLIISLCMICHRRLLRGRPVGPVIDPATASASEQARYSHGVCLDCAPGWMADNGIAPAIAANIMKTSELEYAK
jgi:hypothetical protein